MEIIRAKKMGFCFGVVEAINLCENLHNAKGKKYMLGMLVHNKAVVQKMENKGFEIISEEDLLLKKDNIQENDIVVIRAHGISKEVLEELNKRKAKIYDATCIFVDKIKQEVLRANEEKKSILFVGDKNHPEVKSIISYADDIIIFENLEEAKKIKLNGEKKYFLSTQSTLNTKTFQEIKNYFRENFKNVEIFNKICGATQIRQQSVEELAPNVDIMLIVGDKKSSNTRKLYDISKKLNENSFYIENLEELDMSIFKEEQKIGITAGASTPEEIIKNIENHIRGIFNA